MRYILAHILIVSMACVSCQKDQKKESNNQDSEIKKSERERLSDTQPRSQTRTTSAKRSAIAKAKKLEQLKSKWASLRVDNWPQSFDEKIDYPFKKADQGAEISVVAQIFSKEFDSIFQQEEIDSLIALNDFARNLVFERQQSLPNILLEYAQNPFVIKGDIYICEIFNSAYYGDREKETLGATDNKAWADLAKSPNPLYRRLALNNYRRVVLDPDEWLIFYENFVDDSDPEIIAALVSRVSELGNPKGAELLNRLQEHQVDLLKKNVSLKKKIDESASWLKTLPSK